MGEKSEMEKVHARWRRKKDPKSQLLHSWLLQQQRPCLDHLPHARLYHFLKKTEFNLERVREQSVKKSIGFFSLRSKPNSPLQALIFIVVFSNFLVWASDCKIWEQIWGCRAAAEMVCVPAPAMASLSTSLLGTRSTGECHFMAWARVRICGWSCWFCWKCWQDLALEGLEESQCDVAVEE